MGRKKLGDRVISVEERPTGNLRYRVHFVLDGRRDVESFATKAEAQAFKARREAQTAPLRSALVTDLLDEYRDAMVAKGKWRTDAESYRIRLSVLRRFLLPVIDDPIATIRPADMTACCARWDETRPAFNTRDHARSAVGSFLSWCVKRKHVKSSPLTEDHTIQDPCPRQGRALSIDDARRLRLVIDGPALEGVQSAAYVLTLLVIGHRASELLDATTDHLDDGGRVLKVRDVKKQLTVPVRLPEILVRVLQALASKSTDGRLFGSVPLTGRTRRAAWPSLCVRLWAERAGIADWQTLDARALRRTKDSLAVELGVSLETVARETGHSAAVARKHYVSAGSERTATAERMARDTVPITLPSIITMQED